MSKVVNLAGDNCPKANRVAKVIEVKEDTHFTDLVTREWT